MGRRYRVVELTPTAGERPLLPGLLPGLPSSKPAEPAPEAGCCSRCTLIAHAAMLLMNVTLLLGMHAHGASSVIELFGTVANRCPRSTGHEHHPPGHWRQSTSSREGERMQFEVEPSPPLFLHDGERTREQGGIVWASHSRPSLTRMLSEGAPSCPPCPAEDAAEPAEVAPAEPAASPAPAADPASGEESSGDQSADDAAAAASAEPTGGDVTVAYALIAATVGGSFFIGFLLCWNLGGWNRMFWKLCGSK